ncbi:hypothetical protein ACLOJK_013294 [Asimina triloba]
MLWFHGNIIVKNISIYMIDACGPPDIDQIRQFSGDFGLWAAPISQIATRFRWVVSDVEGALLSVPMEWTESDIQHGWPRY